MNIKGLIAIPENKFLLFVYHKSRTTLLLAGIVFLSFFCTAKVQKFNIAEAPAPLFIDPLWNGSADPTIIWNHIEKEWWIYYTQRRATLDSTQGVEWAHGSAIGITSSKDGKKWDYEGICQGDDNLSDPVRSNCSWWAPEIYFHNNNYHMYVTWVDGIYSNWAGKRYIKHFTSKNGKNWDYQSTLKLSSDRCIDACIYKINFKWYMWYKDEANDLHTWMAESEDLYNWNIVGEVINDCAHEAPFVFEWKEYYWMIIDQCPGPCKYYRSTNGINNWIDMGDILTGEGKRVKDDTNGLHPSVTIIDDKAYIVYHVHYDNKLSALQVAELDFEKNKLVCNRNKYY